MSYKDEALCRVDAIVAKRNCSDCVHFWKKDTGVYGCGKGVVRQFAFEKARGPNGDCGPQGVFFLLKPTLRKVYEDV